MTQLHSTTPRALGRLPHDPERPVLHLAHYLTSKAPAAPGEQDVTYPPNVDYTAQVPDWGLYDNDEIGDCGPAAVANQRRQITRYLADAPHDPTLDDVLDLYHRASGFDPVTGTGDNGVVLADLCSELLRGGIAGTKALAYAAVDVSNPAEVYAATALFGSLLFGVELDVAQDDQAEVGEAWDYVRRSAPWGGHCVLAVGYTGNTGRGAVDFSVITWGEQVGTTDEFLGRQLAEAYVVIWPEHMGTDEFLEGVDLSQLAADYQQLTGRPFPSLPEPEPEPVAPTVPELDPAGPAPDLGDVDPDDALAAGLREFVSVANSWLTAKGK